jgi:uncharacterized cupredoxin-like copper-binding protein
MRRIALLTAGLLAMSIAPAAPSGAGSRTLVLTIRLSRFHPARVQVQAGSVVQFVIHNTDPIDHELIIGPRDVQIRHERGTEVHHGERPGEVSVPLWADAQTTYAFTTAGNVPFACHLPGHFAYGMRGLIEAR